MPRIRSAAEKAADRIREKNRPKRKRTRPKSERAQQWKSKGIPMPTRPQPDFCECCGAPRGGRALANDHDHVTGKFRGWLCLKCNTGIGKLGDSILGLKLALCYLTLTGST